MDMHCEYPIRFSVYFFLPLYGGKLIQFQVEKPLSTYLLQQRGWYYNERGLMRCIEARHVHGHSGDHLHGLSEAHIISAR
jgi:hypothetical protein